MGNIYHDEFYFSYKWCLSEISLAVNEVSSKYLTKVKARNCHPDDLFVKNSFV